MNVSRDFVLSKKREERIPYLDKNLLVSFCLEPKITADLPMDKMRRVI